MNVCRSIISLLIGSLTHPIITNPNRHQFLHHSKSSTALADEFLALGHLCSTRQHFLLLPITSILPLIVSNHLYSNNCSVCDLYHLLLRLNYDHLLLVLRHLRWFLLANSSGRIIFLWQSICVCFLVFTLLSLRNLLKPPFLLAEFEDLSKPLLILSLRISQNLLFYRLSLRVSQNLYEFEDLQNFHFYWVRRSPKPPLLLNLRNFKILTIFKDHAVFMFWLITSISTSMESNMRSSCFDTPAWNQQCGIGSTVWKLYLGYVLLAFVIRWAWLASILQLEGECYTLWLL